MQDWMEIIKLFVLAIGVPLVVFIGNWAWRYDKGYSQTSAADFILAMLVFDISAVVAAKDFMPFLRSPELIPLITYWHFGTAFISGLVWLAITKWGEPALEDHYSEIAVWPTHRFPIWPFLGCWSSVLVLIALHVGFFAVKQGSGHV